MPASLAHARTAARSARDLLLVGECLLGQRVIRAEGQRDVSARPASDYPDIVSDQTLASSARASASGHVRYLQRLCA
jgi:hypothetical protein